MIPVPPVAAELRVLPPVLPLTSTSEVFVPPRGRAFQKFSFDFPEPSVEFNGMRFSVLVFTRENAYGLDASQRTAQATDTGLDLPAGGLVWAGGQERASGRVTARFRTEGDAILCDVSAAMDRPIKAVTTVVRGIPRGKLSSGGEPFDPKDNEILWGYPFGGGDLFGGNSAGGIGTALAVVQSGEQSFVALSSLDDRVRTKRFYFQPGEQGYRVELVHEVEGWLDQPRVQVPTWRIGRAATLDAAVAPHYAHLERAYHFPRWETRTDVPAWLRRTALVVTLHGLHYTGYVFNDYAKMLEILKWIATQMPAERVLALDLGVGRALLLGLPGVPCRRAARRRSRIPWSGERRAAARLPHHADVRCQRREPPPAVVRRHGRCGHGQGGRRHDGPELGGLGQRPSPGRVARIYEPGRRLVAALAHRPHRRRHRPLRRGRLLPRHHRRLDEQHARRHARRSAPPRRGAAPEVSAGVVLRGIPLRRATRVHPALPRVFAARCAVRPLLLAPVGSGASARLERRTRVGVRALDCGDAGLVTA